MSVITGLPARVFRAGNMASRISGSILLMAALAAGGATRVHAQATSATPKSTPAPTPVGAEPQDTTATYGDWLLHCTRAESVSTAQRVCEVQQTLQVKGQGVVAQIAISHLSPKAPWFLTILLPANISLPSQVRVALDDKDDSPAEIQWRRCLPGGCVAEGELHEDTLRSWRAQSATGQIRYPVGTGQPLALTFSFRGLAVALDNLTKPSPAQ